MKFEDTRTALGSYRALCTLMEASPDRIEQVAVDFELSHVVVRGDRVLVDGLRRSLEPRLTHET